MTHKTDLTSEITHKLLRWEGWGCTKVLHHVRRSKGVPSADRQLKNDRSELSQEKAQTRLPAQAGVGARTVRIHGRTPKMLERVHTIRLV